MRRFLVLLPLFLFSFFPVFGQSASDQLSASISLFPSHEQTSEESPADSLKRLKKKQLETLSTISIEKQKLLNEDDEIVQQKRGGLIKQKNDELAAINLDIEHFQELRSHEINNTIRQISWYLLAFALIYLLRIISRTFLSRFAG